MTTDCIFCKVVGGELPAYKIYENEHVIAFLDIYPHAKGHTLVIPKKHGMMMFDFTSEELSQLMTGVEIATKRIQDVLKPDGFNIGWNHGEKAGQVVPHLHVHIMPRWEGDGGGSMHDIISNPGEMEVKDVFELFT